MKTPLLTILLAVALATQLQAQSYTSNIRGVVLDQESRTPLAGATVLLLDSTQRKGAYADDNGVFVLPNVQVGRVAIVVRYVGYEERVLTNLLLTTGKDLQLEVVLRESLIQGQEVVITAKQENRLPQNEFSLNSARSFNVEQTQRYAGSLFDPARMALNFAGTSGGGDTRNDIIIRGNSPLGMIWRFEGVDIPNPNHFATQGANGGPISMLNNNVLANSDFITGAFAAEYGNGTSGAFDLKLRAGNNRKRETTFQIAFTGVELMSEGPLAKGYDGSYLFSYRYSTLAAFETLGLKFGDLLGVPYFQDLSFRVNLPTKKLGNFSIWGVGGLSNIDILESELKVDEFNSNESLSYQDVRQQSNRGSAGITHNLLLDDKSYLRTTVAVSGEYRRLKLDTVLLNRSTRQLYDEGTRNSRISSHIQYNHKFNARYSLRVGAISDFFNTNGGDSLFVSGPNRMLVLRQFADNNYLLRGYAQLLSRLTDRWTLTTGVHSQYYSLNKQTVVEPRAALRWEPLPKQFMSLAYGMHHQTQPTALYYNQNALGQQPNRDLGFTRSQHLVVGYERGIGADFRIKLEGYYQWLDKIPVDRTASSFAAINAGLGFNRVPENANLVNAGTGTNVGVELTVEKFYSQHYYFLFTASVFESKFKGSDGLQRNTAFNNNYVVNLLGGYELPLGREQQNALYMDVKLSMAGGLRYTPVDVAASQAAGSTVYDVANLNTLQTRPYFRPDLKFGFRMNGKKLSQDIGVTLQNVANYDNVLSVAYNPRTQQLVEFGQLNFLPVVQYILRF